MPYSVLLVFTFNILLTEFGASDFSGTGAAIGTVNQIGPIVTVLVVSGAGATAMCADLGARTIRDELDALRVMGINPIQALVVPRVLAATTVALALSASVILVGLTGAFFFRVYVQHVSPGAFVAGLTLLTGTADVIVSLVKATLFGMAAGLIACYKGISVGGGPAGVGNAVNETVVFTFMVLFAINIIVTAVGIQFTVREMPPMSVKPFRASHTSRLRRASHSVVGEWKRIGSQTQFYAKTLMAIPDAVINYRTELLAADRADGTGCRGARGRRWNRRDRRLPDDDHRRPGCGAGLQPVGVSRLRGTDRVRVGVLQCPAHRARDRRPSPCRPPSVPAPPPRSARCGSTRRSTRSR